MRLLILPLAIATSTFVYTGYTFAQTSSGITTESPGAGTTSKTTLSKPLPSKSTPRTTTPTKTQSAKTETPPTQSKSHQPTKEHGHGYSHGGVGVGVGATIDLSGIGQRRAEPDPFAVPAARQPVTPRTGEKPPSTKKRHEVAETDPFTNVQLTGPQAKEQSGPQQ